MWETIRLAPRRTQLAPAARRACADRRDDVRAASVSPVSSNRNGRQEPTTALAVATEREEPLGLAHRAAKGIVDRIVLESGCSQLRSHNGPQVYVRSAGAHLQGPLPERARTGEALCHVETHLEAARLDMGPDRGHEAADGGAANAGSLGERRDTGPYDACLHAAPTRVDRERGARHWVTDEDGDAVGRSHATSEPRVGREQRIALTVQNFLPARARSHALNRRAVDLAQVVERVLGDPKHPRGSSPVLPDVLRRVAHGDGEAQRVEGWEAHAASSREERVFEAGAGEPRAPDL